MRWTQFAFHSCFADETLCPLLIHSSLNPLHIKCRCQCIHLHGGHLVTWHRGIWRDMHSASNSAAAVFIAFDVPIIGIQEPERGSSAQFTATLNAANHQICASPVVIEGKRRAIERIRCSGFDALEICRHSAGI